MQQRTGYGDVTCGPRRRTSRHDQTSTKSGRRRWRRRRGYLLIDDGRVRSDVSYFITGRL